MTPDRFKELKQKLVRETDLSKIWSFYMDHFSDLPEFLDLGKPIRDPFLEAVVPQVCQQMFGRKIAIAGLFPIYIAEHKFFHSPLIAEGRPGGVIYFKDLKKGMLAASAEYPLTDDVLFSRFSESLRMDRPKQKRKRAKFKFN